MNILQKKTKSGSILRLRGTFTSQKAFSFRGWPPTRGSAPGPRWGLCPQTPIIGSRSTRSPWDVPLPNNFSGSAPVSVLFHHWATGFRLRSTSSEYGDIISNDPRPTWRRRQQTFLLIIEDFLTKSDHFRGFAVFVATNGTKDSIANCFYV